MTDFVPEHKRDNFHSYADATWRDLENKYHRRYIVKRMDNGIGFKVVDTFNDGMKDILCDIATRDDADQWMRENRAPEG